MKMLNKIESLSQLLLSSVESDIVNNSGSVSTETVLNMSALRTAILESNDRLGTDLNRLAEIYEKSMRTKIDNN